MSALSQPRSAAKPGAEQTHRAPPPGRGFPLCSLQGRLQGGSTCCTPDILVLWHHSLLPQVRGDQDPPEGGPQGDRGDLPPLLHPSALQSPPLELQALPGLQAQTQGADGSPAHRRGSRWILPRQQWW